MKCIWSVCLLPPVLLGVLAAWAQDTSVTSFSSWLQGEESTRAERSTVARQAVRDRITAVRESRDNTVPLSRSGRWQSDRFARQASSFHLQIQQNTDDGGITGDVNIVGSWLLSEGKINGKITGNTVSGAITDSKGFEDRVCAAGAALPPSR